MTRQLIKTAFFLIFINLFSSAYSQSDSSTIINLNSLDSIQADTAKKWLNIRGPKEWTEPEKAGIMSAVIPGLGQAYNKKYWKIPLIYAVGGFLLSSAIYHHREYKVVKNVLRDTSFTDTTFLYLTMQGGSFLYQDPYTIYTERHYKTARDNQRQKRDRFIVYSSLFYILNVADAIVDAHLSEFDLGDDLSLKINPDLYFVNNKFATGVSLSFNFK